MADLKTRYLGLELKNPIVVGSSGMVKNLDGIRQAADAGAAAVVMKSLFEEQIEAVLQHEEEGSSFYGAEAAAYFEQMSRSHGPRDYLKTIEEARKALSIPLIASLNCLQGRWWVDYAEQLEAAGASALELNIALMPTDCKQSAAEIEERYLDIIRSVKARVKLPLAVKIGPYFTSLGHFAHTMQKAGVDGLVLFNRFYHFTIDVEKRCLAPGYALSTPAEAHLPLRWIALLSGDLSCDLSAATGIHDGLDAARQLLAGAKVVQVCSTLFRHGFPQIGVILGQLEDWMQRQGLQTLEDFRGQLRQSASKHPEAYERLQYIKALVGEE